jgi:hypothetical protein
VAGGRHAAGRRCMRAISSSAVSATEAPQWAPVPRGRALSLARPAMPTYLAVAVAPDTATPGPTARTSLMSSWQAWACTGLYGPDGSRAPACGSQEPKANLKGLVAPLLGAAAKGADEAAPALREAAFGFMVAFAVRVRRAARPGGVARLLAVRGQVAAQLGRGGQARVWVGEACVPAGRALAWWGELVACDCVPGVRSSATRRCWRSSRSSWTRRARRSCRRVARGTARRPSLACDCPPRQPTCRPFRTVRAAPSPAQSMLSEATNPGAAPAVAQPGGAASAAAPGSPAVRPRPLPGCA